MKILFPVASFYPSQLGGPSNTIYWHTTALKKNGIEPYIVSTDLGILKGHQVPVNQWFENESGKVFFSSFFLGLPLRQLLETFKLIPKVDIIQLSSIFYWPSIIFAFWSILCRKKIIWSPRGELESYALSFGSMKKRVYLFILKRINNQNITFHATSKSEEDSIKKIMGGKAEIIIFPNFLPLPKTQDRKPTIPPYFLYIGRIHPIKALDNLILALAQNQDFLNSDFVIYFYGNPQNDFEQQYLKELIALTQKNNLLNKVYFKGYIEGEAKQLMYANAQIFVLPSHSENFANVVIEALAQSTPVIASTGTPWEILNHEKAGFWIDNSVSKLSKKISEVILLDKELYNQLRINALTMVKEHFSIENNIQNWIKTYQTILLKSRF